ncbi:hypothetical protein TNCV_1440621 [Trichonephila clavipes]|nr:hypothetical protein TNCV_1440621 [Trichonephila clavipes]
MENTGLHLPYDRHISSMLLDLSEHLTRFPGHHVPLGGHAPQFEKRWFSPLKRVWEATLQEDMHRFYELTPRVEKQRASGAESKGRNRLNARRKKQSLQDGCELFARKLFFQTQQQGHEQAEESLSASVIVRLVPNSEFARMSMLCGDHGRLS